MEAYTVTWTTTTDELRLIAAIIGKEVDFFETKKQLYSGVAPYTLEDDRLCTLRHIYNQIVAKL